jgi:capsular polysaccharide biosynthesis protein
VRRTMHLVAARMGPFELRGLESLLSETHRSSGHRHVSAIQTGVPRMVPLRSLPTGQHLLSRVPVVELPPDAHWTDESYRSVTPWVCEFDNALVHSDAGIVCVGEQAISDTLGQTSPERHHYAADEQGVTLRAVGPVQAISGRCLSLLNFGPENYYHWTIDGIGRLAAADNEIIRSCQQVLVPTLTHEFQLAGFERTGLHLTHAVRTVAADETLQVESLVVPWGMAAEHRPHPSLRDWFDALPPLPTDELRPLPRRCYIDRRTSHNRRLINEDEVIAALEPMGFVPVRLETLRFAEQIFLFRNAEIIVAPHGAGLANLVYAKPGLRLVELHMDTFVNWCFRRLAAVCHVRYDCVIGRHHWVAGAASVHGQHWAVSTTHVLGAVEQALC